MLFKKCIIKIPANLTHKYDRGNFSVSFAHKKEIIPRPRKLLAKFVAPIKRVEILIGIPWPFISNEYPGPMGPAWQAITHRDSPPTN